jgi:hypothetical protein
MPVTILRRLGFQSSLYFQKENLGKKWGTVGVLVRVVILSVSYMPHCKACFSGSQMGRRLRSHGWQCNEKNTLVLQHSGFCNRLIACSGDKKSLNPQRHFMFEDGKAHAVHVNLIVICTSKCLWILLAVFIFQTKLKNSFFAWATKS